VIFKLLWIAVVTSVFYTQFGWPYNFLFLALWTLIVAAVTVREAKPTRG